MVLVVGFARFNALHQEFLSANFDSVHGARTLLKSRLLIEQAARDLEQAAIAPQYSPLLVSADKRLRNAEHYAAEGVDKDPEARRQLVQRIDSARKTLQRLQQEARDPEIKPRLQAANRELQQLARDVDNAELDRWGALSGLNKELERRMRTMNQLLSATFFLFIGIMTVLAWALLRTRRAESGLLAAKHELEAIQQTTLDASPIGIAFIDTSDPENRRVQTVNRQMAAIFGYEPEMMSGINTRRLYCGDETYQRISREAPIILGSGEVLREEVVMQRRDGMPFWCALSIKAIDPQDIARGVVWTCEEISERKAAEVELQQERARAEAASNAKSEFLANMSHELRTPFTGLFGLLDLLAQSRLDETQRRHLDLARCSAEHMQAIVNDILDFSKIEAGKLIIERIPFRLRHLINAAADFHVTTAQRKGLGFTIDMVEPLVDTLIGDPVRIRQIVDNLLSNAIKFTESGEIRLSVQTETAGNDLATLRITVEDTGIGIPVDVQMRIFDKFTQADSSTTRLYGGTGLGLAICKQLADLMGGQITLTSSLGRGSRFMLALRLPVSTESAVDEGSRHADQRLDSVTIVLADDNAVNRSMLAETLEMHGAVVWPAGSGAEAIRLVAEHHPDLVLMDCQMPGMDGLEATRRIRAAEAPGSHLPIIAVTAFATSNYRDQCLTPGMMDHFLAKPVNTRELLACIHELLRAGKHLPAAPPDAAGVCPPPPPAPAPQSLAKILLVDDNPPILESTRGLLERLGYEVTTARDGFTALRLLEAAAGKSDAEFDLVLMDCQMPSLDGCETARRWRSEEQALHCPPLPIIAITADDRPETLSSVLAAGMNGILAKPFGEEQLTALLADWLH